MAKLRVKNLKQIQNALRKKITKQLRSPEMREGVGEIIVDQIQKEPTPVTSRATIAWRKYLEKANRTSSKYARQLINITFTGELLEDLKNNVKAKFTKGKTEYIIEQSNKKHKKYKKPSGKPVKGKRLSYKEIAKELKNKGYDYLKFSNKSKKRVLAFIKKGLFKNLK